jgi:hypothetical protein
VPGGEPASGAAGGGGRSACAFCTGRKKWSNAMGSQVVGHGVLAALQGGRGVGGGEDDLDPEAADVEKLQAREHGQLAVGKDEAGAASTAMQQSMG